MKPKQQGGEEKDGFSSEVSVKPESKMNYKTYTYDDKNEMHKTRMKQKSLCEFSTKLKEQRIMALRKLKTRNSPLPSIKAKLWAVRLLDEIHSEAIPLPGEAVNDTVNEKINIQMNESLAVVGTDVEALFPSLRDVEAAKIARQAVEESGTQFENINFDLAMKYLYVTGGASHIKEIGLEKVCPRWRGSRPDLLTVGGEALENDDM